MKTLLALCLAISTCATAVAASPFRLTGTLSFTGDSGAALPTGVLDALKARIDGTTIIYDFDFDASGAVPEVAGNVTTLRDLVSSIALTIAGAGFDPATDRCDLLNDCDVVSTFIPGAGTSIVGFSPLISDTVLAAQLAADTGLTPPAFGSFGITALMSGSSFIGLSDPVPTGPGDFDLSRAGLSLFLNGAFTGEPQVARANFDILGATITDLSAVPLPAGAVLLVGALGAFGAVRRRSSRV
ncbi:hypothetical protein GCM10011360_31510 [Primorskyibacter flagellatus]|uniref:VPLPA-CTERM protein sorting domain-containing protein n=1 Tax=Primorskyibacter flagellatus TaxID=1387277 RepID=A0A917ACP3_9RHOB|nr:VPLPA-CTERM sorting domain-containing protein [Primorskyibacter flagellatus]GGE41713.1 hypothetical protein GCM10011360_31510 [Primorskyibacter flagellatus]